MTPEKQALLDSLNAERYGPSLWWKTVHNPCVTRGNGPSVWENETSPTESVSALRPGSDHQPASPGRG